MRKILTVSLPLQAGFGPDTVVRGYEVHGTASADYPDPVPQMGSRKLIRPPGPKEKKNQKPAHTPERHDILLLFRSKIY